MIVKITIQNEVWCSIQGLDKFHVDMLWELFGPYVDGYRHMPLFVMGRWDGRVRFFEKTGKTYVKLLTQIIPLIEKWQYQIDLVDKRSYYDLPPLINEEVFLITDEEINEEEESNLIPNVYLRPYQAQSINLCIEHGCGFIIAGTGAGKTLMTAGISHAFSSAGYNCVTIVPSSDLVDQTVEFYRGVGMDTGVYSGDNKDIDHLNVVATWQALQYQPRLLDNFQALIWDECFSGSQKVKTPNGDIEISQLKIGDIVYSMNKDGTFIEDEIVKVHKNLLKSSNSKMLQLKFDNGILIEVTENHEFYTKTRGKVKAKDLTFEDEIIEFL
jgi:hypothetical protein